MKTWSLQFRVSTCSDIARFNIYNVGANGLRTTNPLHVVLFRDSAETCSGGGTTGPYGLVTSSTKPTKQLPGGELGGRVPTLAACHCAKTGAFASPQQHSISATSPTGDFKNALGTFTIRTTPAGSAAQLAITGPTGASVFSPPPAVAWGLSPDNLYFVVVGPLVGTNAGAPLQVFRVALTPFTQVVNTMVWPDGYWGFSPDGSQFIVARGKNVQSGNSTKLDFSFEDHNLVGPNPNVAKRSLTESGVFAPSLAFSPCGNLLMYFDGRSYNRHRVRPTSTRSAALPRRPTWLRVRPVRRRPARRSRRAALRRSLSLRCRTRRLLVERRYRPISALTRRTRQFAVIPGTCDSLLKRSPQLSYSSRRRGQFLTISAAHRGSFHTLVSHSKILFKLVVLIEGDVPSIPPGASYGFV